jgi:hypothetical protein
MDVKSVFLYGTINEIVFVKQPPGYEDQYFPDHVYKLDKALYGLNQTPCAWYHSPRMKRSSQQTLDFPMAILAH